MALTAMAQNYRKNVDWILGAYTDAGISFPNGFQKDAIQNAVGARKSAHKWNGWHCDISVISNAKGQFIVVEDSGTVGLTGRNIPASELEDMMKRDEKLPPEERLARFSSMFNSGGNTAGGGLYGAGKSVYAVASEQYIYYYDSLREDGQYVANVNDAGYLEDTALEGSKAKEYIFEHTGLAEKTTIGTRVIIVSPKAELVDSIMDGSIIPYIQESWWIIIQRLADDAAIAVNGVKVEVPDDIKATSHAFELSNTVTVSPGHKVKHFGFYVFDDGNNRWNGISYYRKGMKIGDVDLKDIPSKIDGKYWGFVEVDEQWESDLSDIEDKVHFGVSRGKKPTKTYQDLKNFCNERVKANLVQWGFIRDRENEDKKLRDQLKVIAEDIQNLFDRLGFEDLGKGPQKPDFDVRWQDITFPVPGSERVSTDDKIGFSVRINSSYITDKKFEYKLSVVNPQTGEVVSLIANDTISVPSNTVKKLDFIHTVSPSNSVQYAENRIVLSVKVIGSGKDTHKELPYFFDIDRPDNSREVVNLVLHECTFPVQGSRRVNFGESLTNISYLIENKRNYPLNYRLNVSIHNASDPTCPKLVDIDSSTGSIAPFEETITPTIDEISFTRDFYEQFLPEGVLELRARLIANGDDPQYEKGDRITYYNYKVFLNRDEKNGKNDSFDPKNVNAPEDYRRSWSDPGTGRTITINIGHVAYQSLSDYPELQYSYLKELMLKEYVLLYLAEGKYDMFNEAGKEFGSLDPQEAVFHVIDKIERIYNQSLR